MMSTIKAFKTGTTPTVLNGFLASVLLALAAILFVVGNGPPAGIIHSKRHYTSVGELVPQGEVPQVEPTTFRAMPPFEARAFNAAVPFSTAPNPPARPFRFVGAPEDRLRALDCLTAAVLYEAGDDPVGQPAVALVVLNRVRHPAFPKTVCGVVFQGSKRRAGCQFTFTCDGALKRSYSEPLWQRARLIADAALSGSVYASVGQATHYHTDWVVPYWSSSLDKIVAVKTHLFFRWSGWWGTPPAFRFNATGQEPRIAQLALRFPEHSAAGGDLAALSAPDRATELPLGGTSVPFKPTLENPNVFFVQLLPADVSNLPEIAAQACGDRPVCRFTGWTDSTKVPTDNSLKLTPQQENAISFRYIRERSVKYERAFWNCDEFKRPDAQCIWASSQRATSPPLKPKTLPTAMGNPSPAT
jgi:hypothetical protein